MDARLLDAMLTSPETPPAELRAAAPAMSRILAIANIKGGVGKTTTTANLAAAVVERGRKVLAVDLDPQASLTLSVGLQPEQLSLTIRDALTLTAKPVSELLQTTRAQFDIVPANHDLRAIERELEAGRIRVFALRDVLEPLRLRYDYILLDCPASAGIFTGNALAAANEVIIPFPPDYLGLQAVDWLLRLIREIKSRINPNLHVAGFLLGMYDPRTRHSRSIISAAQKRYGTEIPFFSSMVPLNVHIREAPLEGQTVLQYAPRSPAAAAYRSLALEVEEGIHEAEPQDVYGAVRRGRAEMEQNDRTSAYIAFCRATEFDPNEIEGWIGRAQSTSDANDAIRCWARAAQLRPADAPVREALKRNLDERLFYATAIDIQELLPLGHFLLEVGQRTLADDLFRRIIELDAKNEPAWIGRAQSALDPQLAVVAFTRALELNPANPQTQRELAEAQGRVRSEAACRVDDARALAQKGDREQAHRLFRQAVEMDPQNDRGWVGCARTCDDQSQALQWVRKALEINPDNAEAQNLYRWLWVPEKEGWTLPLPWQTLVSILLALVILSVAFYLIFQHFWS